VTVGGVTSPWCLFDSPRRRDAVVGDLSIILVIIVTDLDGELLAGFYGGQTSRCGGLTHVASKRREPNFFDELFLIANEMRQKYILSCLMKKKKKR